MKQSMTQTATAADAVRSCIVRTMILQCGRARSALYAEGGWLQGAAGSALLRRSEGGCGSSRHRRDRLIEPDLWAPFPGRDAIGKGETEPREGRLTWATPAAMDVCGLGQKYDLQGTDYSTVLSSQFDVRWSYLPAEPEAVTSKHVTHRSPHNNHAARQTTPFADRGIDCPNMSSGRINHTP